jgi:membrane protease YdiL (CAAX protease family)
MFRLKLTDTTRLPWASVLFVVPLVVFYEVGVRMLGPVPDDLRTGADVWTREVLAHFGIVTWSAPLLLVAGLTLWALLFSKGPLEDPMGTWIAMAMQSVLFAALLFLGMQLAYPAIAFVGGSIQDPLDRLMAMPDVASSSPEQTWTSMVRFMGAGIYEETLFRLFLFSMIRLLFVLGDFPDGWSSVLAAILSSLAFAAAHQVGLGHVNVSIFLYRTLAGLYFAWLFQRRGFGVAVGSHVGFDILVGLIMR